MNPVEWTISSVILVLGYHTRISTAVAHCVMSKMVTHSVGNVLTHCIASVAKNIKENRRFELCREGDESIDALRPVDR